MSSGSGGHPADAELARHWRRIGRMAQQEEAVRAMRDSVLSQMPEEFRSGASGGGASGVSLGSADANAEGIAPATAASSSAAPSASALPVTAFLRALGATRFARSFFRKRVRELREQFCLPTHDESAQPQQTLIDDADDASPVAAASPALLAECAHVDVASLTLLASCHEKLGELRIARALFDAATKARTDSSGESWSSGAVPARPSPASGGCHAQWSIEVERLTRQLRMDERRAKRAAQVHPEPTAGGPPPAPFEVGDLPPPRRVDRVCHTHLSHARFLEHYVARRIPVVIEGLSDIMFASAPREPISQPSFSSSCSAAASHESAAQSQSHPQPATATAAATATHSGPWNFSSLQLHLQHLTAVPLKFSNPHSTAWAKLEESGTKRMVDILAEMQAQRQREVAEQQRRRDARSGASDPSSSPSSDSASAPSPPIPSYYVHDYSLALSAPQLLHSSLTIPHYFCGDEFQLLRAGSAYRDTWPSLFVGARGSRSDLHVDALSTHFWMAMCGDPSDDGEGGARKRWVIYDPADLPLLYPSYSSFQSIEPSFDVLPYEALFVPQMEGEGGAATATAAAAASGPTGGPSSRADSFFARQHSRFPLLRLARPRVVTLRPGEVLFVPAGSPHYVENQDTTLSISANFLLRDNRGAFARDSACMAAMPAHEQMREQMREQQRAPDALAQRRSLRVQLQQECLRNMEAQTAAAAPLAHAPGHSPSQSWPRHLPFSVFKMDDANLCAAHTHGEQQQQQQQQQPTRLSQKRTVTGAMMTIVANAAEGGEFNLSRPSATATTLNPPSSDSGIKAAAATDAAEQQDEEEDESTGNESSCAKRARQGDEVAGCAGAAAAAAVPGAL